MANTLEDLRRSLDSVDQRLVSVLAERRTIVAEVARLKAASAEIAVRDPVREQAIVDRARALASENGLDPDHVERLFREMLDHSVDLQREYLAGRKPDAEVGRYVVGYQGGEGAFSHIAAKRHFRDRGEPVFVGHPTFASMLEALAAGELRYVVLPIENSIAGSIHESFDLLARMDLHLVGEEIQPVKHCLIALESIPISRIRRVMSHPVALAQCRRFLGSLENCHVESYVDTALAVEKVKIDQDPSQAAIASEEAAALHGLPVIARDIADDRENFTRMVIVARDPVTPDVRVASKTALLFSLEHRPGALARVITALANHGLNLTKIESRPVPGAPFEYSFHVDFEGNTSSPNVVAALAELRKHTRELRILGCYPAAALPAQG